MVVNEAFLVEFEVASQRKKHKKDELLNDWGATLVRNAAGRKIPPLKFPFINMLRNVINTHSED